MCWKKVIQFLTPVRSKGKPSAKQPLMAFPVLSDIHVQSWNTLSQQKLKSALEDLNRINSNVKALIINGDLGDGQSADYDTLKSILYNSSHHEPIFFTIGNHEFYKAYYNTAGKWSPETFPNGEQDLASIARFLAFTGLTNIYYDQWIDGFHFIFLGSEQYKQTDPSILEDAFLSQEQLHWLHLKLAEGFVAGKPIFVFLHQPLPDTVSGSSLERGVVQHAELRNLLCTYPEVIYFSGHTHWELKLATTVYKDKFTMFNSSSVFQPYSEKNKPIPGNKSEGLYVEVYTDKVVVKGRDFAKKAWVSGAEYTVETARTTRHRQSP